MYRLIGKMVADGGEVPGREGTKIPAGTVLYKVNMRVSMSVSVSVSVSASVSVSVTSHVTLP